VRKVSLNEFNKIAEEIHLACFGEHRPKEMNTFDFALIVLNEKEPIAYSTIIEHDRETVYMQHGGAFPNVEKTPSVAKAYHLMIAWVRENYKFALTQVLNLNVPMLKLAMSTGFIITGVNLWEDGIWLQLTNDFMGGK
jgi:hypothetical protein